MSDRECLNLKCKKNYCGYCEANIECLVMCEDYIENPDNIVFVN